MGNLSGFHADPNQVRESFQPVPAGWYDAEIVESEFRENKSGTGRHLYLAFSISDEDCFGRKVFARLNIDNPSQRAMEIAKAQLNEICLACGVNSPNDSSDLHNLPLKIFVKLESRDSGEVDNKITQYKRAGKEEKAAPKSPPVPAKPPQGNLAQRPKPAAARPAPAPAPAAQKKHAWDTPF